MILKPQKISSYGTYFGFSIILSLCIFWVWLFTRLPLDDAYIYARYAKNLAHGFGPVFNVAEHVEGYSGFIWLIFITIGSLLGLPEDRFAQVLSISSYFSIIITLFCYGHRAHGQSYKSLIYPALYAASTACALWAGLAIEMLFFSIMILLTLLSYLYLSKNQWQRVFTGLLACLASLSRPEGITVYIYILAFELCCQIRKQQKVDWQRLAAYSAGMVIFIFFIYSRWAYYGYILPNTFYAKVSFNSAFSHRGLESLYEFISTHCGGKYFLAAVTVHGLLCRTKEKEWWLMAPFTLCFFGIVIKSGGDWWPFARYALPIYPIIVILFGNFFIRGLSYKEAHTGWRRLIKSATAFSLVLMLFITANTVLMSSRTFPRSIFTPDYNRSFLMAGRFYGKLAQKLIGSNGTFALAPIPCVSHYFNGYILDTLGLTDSHIAHRPLTLGYGTHGHEKGDGNYVLNMRPQLFRFFGHLDLLGAPLEYPSVDSVYFVTDREISNNPHFKELYEPFPIKVRNSYAMFWKLRNLQVLKPDQRELDALYDEMVASQRRSIQTDVLEKFYTFYNQIERYFAFAVYQKIQSILAKA